MVVIIGGGVTGLTAAYRLSKAGIPVTVMEQDGLGGALGSYKIGNYHIESFYHHVFGSDHEFFRLAKELGLGEKLVWKNSRTGFYSKGKFYELSGAVHLLRFGLLSKRERLRIASFALKIKSMSKKRVRELDNVSAKSWIEKNLGMRIYENFFEPMLRSKYGKDIDSVSAAWFIERMKIRSNRGLTGEKLCYMEGGFYQFVRNLEDGIRKHGGKIIRNSPVMKIETKSNSVKAVIHKNGKIIDKCVISTVPPASFLRISNIRGDYARRLKRLEYQGAVSVLIGIDNRLTDFYWTNIIKGDENFGAVVEHTNFMPKGQYGGDNIIYLASYPPHKSGIWKMEKKKIFNLYLRQLREMLPDSEIRVKWWRVSCMKDAGLIYKKGILSNIPEAKTNIKGLFAGGMFNSYPERSINESVRIGNECSKLAKEFLEK